MALPTRRRCGQGSCFLSKSPLDKRDHGPKHQEWSLHIFKAFDETYEAKRPLQSTSMHCQSLVGLHLERCAFDASEPRFVSELCGALARRPLWDTRTLVSNAFHTCSGSPKLKDSWSLQFSAGWASTFSCFNSWLNHRLLVICFVLFWALETLKEQKLPAWKFLSEETARLRPPADLENGDNFRCYFQEADVGQRVKS